MQKQISFKQLNIRQINNKVKWLVTIFIDYKHMAVQPQITNKRPTYNYKLNECIRTKCLGIQGEEGKKKYNERKHTFPCTWPQLPEHVAHELKLSHNLKIIELKSGMAVVEKHDFESCRFG